MIFHVVESLLIIIIFLILIFLQYLLDSIVFYVFVKYNDGSYFLWICHKRIIDVLICFGNYKLTIHYFGKYRESIWCRHASLLDHLGILKVIKSILFKCHFNEALVDGKVLFKLGNVPVSLSQKSLVSISHADSFDFNCKDSWCSFISI